MSFFLCVPFIFADVEKCLCANTISWWHGIDHVMFSSKLLDELRIAYTLCLFIYIYIMFRRHKLKLF